jgi:hypothetical protein
MPREIRIQLRIDESDLKIIKKLMKKYGSSRSEILRRGLRCLDATEGKK